MGPDKAGVQLDVSSGSGVSGDGGDEVCQVGEDRGRRCAVLLPSACSVYPSVHLYQLDFFLCLLMRTD